MNIWTHASSMDVFNGYPFTKNSVIVGSHVWITAGTTILPGVEIGSHVIIGNSSLVNKDIPDGCFAAGSPVKIIKEHVYPKVLLFEEKKEILNEIIDQYKKLLALKSFKPEIIQKDNLKIEYRIDQKITTFDCVNKKIMGDINKYSEDFRDFLRYRGVKFFTDIPFQSITPDWYDRACEKNSSGK